LIERLDGGLEELGGDYFLIFFFIFALGELEEAKAFVVVSGCEFCSMFFQSGFFVFFDEWVEEIKCLLPLAFFHECDALLDDLGVWVGGLSVSWGGFLGMGLIFQCDESEESNEEKRSNDVAEGCHVMISTMMCERKLV
jgi:hypothetical protein